ncbi:hypothetical protein IAR55_007143 [Kwoniella newhampshirensis]|uniref:Phosphatidylglycerol/phosphatidylinositol transfer protein n=1 Tax=Kwoniella newhampshirensis TaxID=1651941 RepID=A0AAW0YDQ0_9TREE
MHPSALVALLPLLLLSTMAAPPQRRTSMPMPFFHARSGGGGGGNTLDLPPSFVSPSIKSIITSQPTPLPTSQDQAQALDRSHGGGQGIWAINTVPLSLIDKVLSDVGLPAPAAATLTDVEAEAGAKGTSLATTPTWMSSSPTGTATSSSDTDADMPPLTAKGEWSVSESTATQTLATLTALPTSISAIGAASATTTTLWWTPPPTASSSSDGWQTVAAVPSATSSSVFTSASATMSRWSAPPSSIITNWSSATSAPSTTARASATSTTATAATASTSIAATGTGTAMAMALSAPASSPNQEKEKEKKIRFKHCSETHGTITEITVSPCESGKGTINDPCHFHAGSNYTITLTYVSPINSSIPRSNLSARDRTGSEGSEKFPYPGQSFDGCSYTTCPIVAQETSTYTYEFATQNNRFDQLTFDMTDGLDGDSLMCAYFPVTFMPPVTGRSLLPRLPFAGLQRGF